MRVLLPIDADETRAKMAAETVLALPNAAEEVHVTVVNVQQKLDVTDEGSHVESEEWYDPENYPESLDTVVDILEREGIDVEKRREHGEPAEEIITIADEIGADRIIMCGRQRTPVGKVLFGSVTQSVLLNSNVPVTVIAE